MSNKKFTHLLMALVAMSFFKPSLSLAQTKSNTNSNFKIKTPNTKTQLLDDKAPAAPAKTVSEDSAEESSSSPSYSSTSAAPRRLNQHGLGIGLGQTMLMGKYGKYGEDKITADILYSYAASYSFDLLVNAHMSEHKDKNERMKVMGLTTSIKARLVEYDNFSPFVLGGLGFYAPRAKRIEHDGGNSWSDQKVTFGLNFGGGLDLRLNENYVVGILGQLHSPFAIKQDDGPDVKGYYFKLLITGMYLF